MCKGKNLKYNKKKYKIEEVFKPGYMKRKINHGIKIKCSNAVHSLRVSAVFSFPSFLSCWYALMLPPADTAPLPSWLFPLGGLDPDLGRPFLLSLEM